MSAQYRARVGAHGGLPQLQHPRAASRDVDVFTPEAYEPTYCLYNNLNPRTMKRESGTLWGATLLVAGAVMDGAAD